MTTVEEAWEVCAIKLEQAETRIAELEATLTQERRTYASVAEQLKARIAELEGEVREQQKALDLIYTRETTRIAELEGERNYHRTAHDSAVQRIAELTKRNNKLEGVEGEIKRLTAQVRPFSDALAERVIATQVAEIDRLTAKLARLTDAQLEKEAHMDCYQYGVVP